MAQQSSMPCQEGKSSSHRRVLPDVPEVWVYRQSPSPAEENNRPKGGCCFCSVSSSDFCKRGMRENCSNGSRYGEIPLRRSAQKGISRTLAKRVVSLSVERARILCESRLLRGPSAKFGGRKADGEFKSTPQIPNSKNQKPTWEAPVYLTS